MDTPISRPVVPPHEITDPYGPRILQGRAQHHDGIDYITASDPGGDAWPGDRSVICMADGVVTFAKHDYDHSRRWTDSNHSAGNMVIIKSNLHGTEYYIRYLHLISNTVRAGAQVTRGQVIGRYADVGYSFGAHVHVDLMTMSWVKIDPTAIFLRGLRAAGIIT
jgi:murein DD-endopeptidase MepM/ murein hydrolase activator NlpD